MIGICVSMKKQILFNYRSNFFMELGSGYSLCLKNHILNGLAVAFAMTNNNCSVNAECRCTTNILVVVVLEERVVDASLSQNAVN